MTTPVRSAPAILTFHPEASVSTAPVRLASVKFVPQTFAAVMSV